MTIGENIRKIRKEKGLTQKKLGELCNMNEVQIRQYELGKAKPKLETAIKIATALSVDIGKLIEDCNIVFPPAKPKRSTSLLGDCTLEDDLLDAFYNLNDEGQKEAVKRVDELTEIPKYSLVEEKIKIITKIITDD